MNDNIEKKLITNFSEMFPGYRLEKVDDGYKLLREGAIKTEGSEEAVWIATVHDMAELFMLMELNRRIVNSRLEGLEELK